MPDSRNPAPQYLVGIDLGTTHTVAAYSPLSDGARPRIELFPIDQLVQPGAVAALPLLPSVRYQASRDEVAEQDMALPWPPSQAESDCRPIVGELARRLGAKSRGRLIASAKSWLSHPSVDRTAPILPWGAPEEVPKISPVEASASYLRHVRDAWNVHHPDAPLADQELVVTVPASFDEAARALTREAAKLAGLPVLRLLEEPQAVCYDWLWQHRKALRTQLKDTRLLLVVDIGGGTTDLTLIKIEPGVDEPRLTRVAVGNHLMLGGDNIDLALAHRVEQRMLDEDQRLSATELSQLMEQCRIAKERLLADGAPDAVTVTLLGSGSRLIGAARSAELRREEAQSMVLEGFFPRVEITDLPERKRSGVVEFGLPYAADPAISRHLAAFLGEHRHAAQEAVGGEAEIPIPDALLLNGGVFRSPLIVRRLLEQIAAWGGRQPTLLENDRPDLAVAYGAVAYGLARRGQALQRIAGGAARSYFLLVETGPDEPPKGVCILPRGAEEGREIVLGDRSFLLKLGFPVRFNLAASTDDYRPRPGELVEIDEARFQSLPPLAVVLDRETGAGGAEQAVRIAASLSEVGVLDMHCVAVDDPQQRWNVEFQLRGPARAVNLEVGGRHPNLEPALEKIRRVFGKKTRDADPKAIKGLRNELEKMLGPRDEWDTPLLRELFAALLEGLPNRRRSADHERVWCSLTGFCLRPGFGYPLDDWRVERVFAVYDQGLQFVHASQNWAEWWTLWRRVAGGLSASAQQRVFADLADFINPDRVRRGNLPALAKQRSYEDMLRLAAVLERLPVANKIDMGGWLLKRLAKLGEAAEGWWALGRIGGRVPFHGSPHNLVPRAMVETWLQQALQHDFRKEPHPAFAAAMLARMSGDRERDIGDVLRQQVVKRLRAGKAPESWIAMVTECKALTEADEKRLFGESLPPGLKLIG
jgi:molecular chaperone DnaK (HSP70)